MKACASCHGLRHRVYYLSVASTTMAAFYLQMFPIRTAFVVDVVIGLMAWPWPWTVLSNVFSIVGTSLLSWSI